VACSMTSFGIKYNHAELPAIVIFTKYDKLVTNVMLLEGETVAHLSDEEVWQYSKCKAKEEVENLCICPWMEKFGTVPLMVSSRVIIHDANCMITYVPSPLTAKSRFQETVRNLIEATDVEIQRQTGVSSHTDPRSFNFAAAQRLHTGMKIDASIEWVLYRMKFKRALKLCLYLSIGKLSMSVFTS
jgi:hypothetical protein